MIYLLRKRLGDSFFRTLIKLIYTDFFSSFKKTKISINQENQFNQRSKKKESSQFTILLTVHKIDEQAQSHPTKKYEPRFDWNLNHQIGAK